MFLGKVIKQCLLIFGERNGYWHQWSMVIRWQFGHSLPIDTNLTLFVQTLARNTQGPCTQAGLTCSVYNHMHIPRGSNCISEYIDMTKLLQWDTDCNCYNENMTRNQPLTIWLQSTNVTCCNQLLMVQGLCPQTVSHEHPNQSWIPILQPFWNQ